MKSMYTYLNFLKVKGMPLAEINPGSDEIALPFNDALQALEILKETETIVLGGDVLSKENNGLVYAYQLWGDEYQYLNWYCDKAENETKADYLHRSYVVAKESVINSNRVAKKLKKECYIVFVIE